MSYRVEYNPEKHNKYPIPTQKKPKWIFVALVVFVAIFTLQKSEKLQSVRSWLIPGNPEITAAAFSTMVDQVRSGEPVREAVTTFCQEIIDNG